MKKGSVDEEGESLHPLDAQLRGLGLEKLDPIEKTTSEFEVLKKLLLNSKGRFLSLVVVGGELIRWSRERRTTRACCVKEWVCGY